MLHLNVILIIILNVIFEIPLQLQFSFLDYCWWIVFFSNSVKALKFNLNAWRLLCRAPDLIWVPAAVAACLPIHPHRTRLHHLPCLISHPSCCKKSLHQRLLKFILMLLYVLGKSPESPAFFIWGEENSSFNLAWSSNARKVWFQWPWWISYFHISPFPLSLCTYF